jgi:sugar phosphate isomerase/epimerase
MDQNNKTIKTVNLKLSRREFFVKSTLAFAAASLAQGNISGISQKGNYNEGPINKCRMKVGSDTDKLPGALKKKGAIAVLDYLKNEGFDGAFFRLMLDLSPTLDPVELKEVKAHADSIGLFLEAGIGWINPYNTAERPEIRRFGNGDYRLAIEKMISAAQLINCKELWAVSAHSIHGDPFYVAYDRFRTDVTWDDQIESMYKFIRLLSPVLKDTGCRLNLEAHGDETSFEAQRLIERLGPDILGVTLDTGNLPLQADYPMYAIKRLAPYVHMTHCKDGILYRTANGLNQQIRSLGDGIIDWKSALEEINRFNPDLHLCIEDYRAENLLLWSTSKYKNYYPDLTAEEIAAFEQMTTVCENKIKSGKILGVEEFRKLTFGEKERDASYLRGAEYLRKIINQINL